MDGDDALADDASVRLGDLTLSGARVGLQRAACWARSSVNATVLAKSFCAKREDPVLVGQCAELVDCAQTFGSFEAAVDFVRGRAVDVLAVNSSCCCLYNELTDQVATVDADTLVVTHYSGDLLLNSYKEKGAAGDTASRPHSTAQEKLLFAQQQLPQPQVKRTRDDHSRRTAPKRARARSDGHTDGAGAAAVQRSAGAHAGKATG